jgi:hypothetical protein
MVMEATSNDTSIFSDSASHDTVFSAQPSSANTTSPLIPQESTELQTEQRSDKQYYQANFPQPYTVGFGYTKGGSSSNQIDTTRQYVPTTWTITRTGTGAISLTHNLGTKDLIASFNPYAPALSVYIVSQTINAFSLQLYSTTGAAVDAVFGYSIEACH